MTVCIAAICDHSKTIVAAYDKMLSLEFTSADTIGRKFYALGGGWAAMIAADDVTASEAIIERAKTLLSNKSKNIQQVETAFADSFGLEKKHRAEKQILSAYGFTMSRFTREGYRSLGKKVFHDLYQKIEKIKLDCDFLIAGFDQRKRPQLSIVTKSGTNRCSRIGFAAIGVGWVNAVSSFYLHEYRIGCPFSLAVYLVAEAKFLAEYAPGVGRRTNIVMLKPNDEAAILSQKDVEVIRKEWERDGKPKPPNGIQDKIAGFTWG